MPKRNKSSYANYYVPCKATRDRSAAQHAAALKMTPDEHRLRMVADWCGKNAGLLPLEAQPVLDKMTVGKVPHEVGTTAQWLVEHIKSHPESWQESALASYNEATAAQQG